MRTFTYGQEADDYFRSRILFDGDRLSTLLLTLDLAQGEVTAKLPEDVDVTKLYKFRTDIFWGRPERVSMGSPVTRLIELLAEIGKQEDGILVSECWTMTGFDPEQRDVDHFSYQSTKHKGDLRHCHFLRLTNAGERRLRSFLDRCDCDHPIIFSDLSSHFHEADNILPGNEVSEKILSAIVQGTAHLIFDVYDGGAHLIWNRRSRQYMIEKQQKGNVQIS